MSVIFSCNSKQANFSTNDLVQSLGNAEEITLFTEENGATIELNPEERKMLREYFRESSNYLTSEKPISSISGESFAYFEIKDREANEFVLSIHHSKVEAGNPIMFTNLKGGAQKMKFYLVTPELVQILDSIKKVRSSIQSVKNQ